MPIIGVPRCLENPFSRACDASILVKKRTSELDPRTEACCLSPYSVCSKRLPCKKYFYLLNSYNIKRVLGVVYC
ncbi:CGH_1_HP_G0015480.mRNA.1.CDS.1 [Saccharomyces cerevisiae]|nr:CGH_1_HP_G0015480.mRNA.1.CDS.1 [Saccharomyces cerevisiae]CAI6428450.1 CGH_1_HP_G0015480.mRNA.1.CDS.1 [Saccharomyces cerevisiae]